MRSPDYEAYRITAEGVLRSSGSRAPVRLEWWESARPFAGPDVDALFSLFEAQGRTATTSHAVARLVGGGATSSGGVVLGAFDARQEADEVHLLLPRDLDPCDRVVFTGKSVERDVLRPLPAVGIVDAARAWFVAPGAAVRSEPSTPDPAGERLARVALAHEILGACCRLRDLAVDYAAARRQFGRPIAAFQAVAHLLAEVEVQTSSLSALCAHAADLVARGELDDVVALAVKAHAGRVGDEVGQKTGQVIGAMSFTWEFEHRALLHRILALDEVLGDATASERAAGGLLMAHGLEVPLHPLLAPIDG